VFLLPNVHNYWTDVLTGFLLCGLNGEEIDCAQLALFHHIPSEEDLREKTLSIQRYNIETDGLEFVPQATGGITVSFYV
jgi:hypothetical protein